MSVNTRLNTSYLLLACCMALLLSCVTKAPLIEPTVDIRLHIEELTLSAIDIDSVSASLRLRIVNAGGATLVLSDLSIEARSGTAAIVDPVHKKLNAMSLAPGNQTSIDLDLLPILLPGDKPMVPISILATLSCAYAGGRQLSISAETTSDVPRILPPVLRIVSIRILKDELINTKLRVDLEVGNPNLFPISFSSLDYRLYGEGRYWASDSIAKPFTVMPLETSTAGLYLTMNFTDMSRALLDQVIHLASVRYQLLGNGIIDTGLDFLPQFTLPFDMSGQAEVLR